LPDVVAYPEHGYAWVATRDPDPELLARGGDPGIIARFEIPSNRSFGRVPALVRHDEEAARAASSLTSWDSGEGVSGLGLVRHQER